MADSTGPMDEARFMQLLAMFQMAAMQHMGKIPNPVTNKIERDLEQARISMDMVEMLQRKTSGNRSEIEDSILGKIIFELQMNFVDESGKPDKAAAEPGGDDGSGEAPDKGGASGD